MCKPATEVANLTQLESHTVRARTLMFWRIAKGYIDWGPREVELTYESTLDSVSGAFDIFHYPIYEYMLDARADIWDRDLAPDNIKEIVAASAAQESPTAPQADILLLAGEIAQLGEDSLLSPIASALETIGTQAVIWVVPSGALAYALGAWQVAKQQAQQVVTGIQNSGANRLIVDGPETAWALTKVYPSLGVELPSGLSVELLSELLAEGLTPAKQDLGKVFVHDSRPAYLISTQQPSHTAILPGYTADESSFGKGVVYEAPRQLLDSLGAERVWGPWTRALARTSGADDGLWLTYPDLADGLADQRLKYAESLGADTLVTDSPLAAAFLAKHATGRHDIRVKLLAQLLI